MFSWVMERQQYHEIDSAEYRFSQDEDQIGIKKIFAFV